MKDFLKSLRAQSEKQLANEASRAWWEACRNRADVLSDFETTLDLRRYLDCRSKSTSFFSRRDRVLRQLLIEHRRPTSIPGRASSHLWIAVYWPLLPRAVRRVTHLGAGRAIEAAELQSEVVRQFLELLSSLSLEKNRDIHTSLTRRLPHVLTAWAHRECNARLSEALPTEEQGSSEEPLPMFRPEHPRSGWELDAAHRAFDELLALGVIDEVAHSLLVSTRIDRVSLKQVVHEPANSNAPRLGYEAARKRLSRAQSRIRRHMAANDSSLVELAIEGLKKLSTETEK